MASASAWLVTFRLRTLPLSLSTIILGSCLAAYHHHFNTLVCVLAIATTLFLQILSNIANDYGDTLSGVDNKDRVGPQRSLQSGIITLKQMKSAIIIFVLLSLFSGVSLIYVVFHDSSFSYNIVFFIIGLAAIVAAMKYTMGKRPYGYAGLGDLFVFIFFGLVGVMGSYFLYTHQLTVLEFLPAISIGCFSTGVLNLNNMRDRNNDAAHGKQTLVVKLGMKAAKNYHALLLIIGMVASIGYIILAQATFWKWLFLISFIGIIRSIVVVYKNKEAALLDPELKKLAIATLIFSVLFGLGLLI